MITPFLDVVGRVVINIDLGLLSRVGYSLIFALFLKKGPHI